MQSSRYDTPVMFRVFGYKSCTKVSRGGLLPLVDHQFQPQFHLHLRLENPTDRSSLSNLLLPPVAAHKEVRDFQHATHSIIAESKELIKFSLSS